MYRINLTLTIALTLALALTVCRQHPSEPLLVQNITSSLLEREPSAAIDVDYISINTTAVTDVQLKRLADIVGRPNRSHGIL